MTDEDLEFSISQYLDGTLPEDQRAAVEDRLAQDPEAQTLLDQDRRLTDLLRASPLPDVQWDRFADSISGAIDRQLEDRMAAASWWMRLRIPAGLAIAASALLAIGLAIRMNSGGNQYATPRGHDKPLGQQAVAMLSVQGPQEDAPAGPAITQISIGAGGSYANASPLAPYANEIDNRPSRVVIASGLNPDQPPVNFPY